MKNNAFLTSPSFYPNQNSLSELVYHQLSFDQDAAHLDALNLGRTVLLLAQPLSEEGYANVVYKIKQLKYYKY